MQRFGLLFVVVATLMLFAATTTPGVAQSQDPQGTITPTGITCPPGKTKGSNTCTELAISNCPNTASINAYIKVTQPAETPVATVVLGSGGQGTQMYETFTDGMTVVNGLLADNFTVIQLSYGGPFTKNQPNGWETGSGGPRAAACNYSTPLIWIAQNQQLVAPGIPLCATGNSDGAELLGYGLAHHGLGDYLALAELTSGPPYPNEYEGCVKNAAPKTLTPCGAGMQGFWVGKTAAEEFIDPTYEPAQGPLCSQGLKSNESFFLADSILSNDGTAQLSYPYTQVNVLIGDLDQTIIQNAGNAFYLAITSPLKNLTCVAGAGHSMPNYAPGATQILNDLVTQCKLQQPRPRSTRKY